MRASVVVVGSGPAGAMAARRLALGGVDVQLVDRAVAGWHPGETLSPEGRATLSRAGLWDRRPSRCAMACPAVLTAWGHPIPTARPFLVHPYGVAWHVDRRLLDAWLLREAEEAGAERVVGTAVLTDRSSDGWTIEVDRPNGLGSLRLRAEGLIIATGRRGTFAARFARRHRLDELVLVGGFAPPSTEAGATLLVEAMNDGWWYSAPTPAGEMFVGWMTDARLAKGRRSRGALTASLAQAPLTRARLSSLPEVRVVPAISSWINPCAGDGWIAVGDAALARDPLSGDGLAVALHSGWEAGRMVLDALSGAYGTWAAAAVSGQAQILRYVNQRRRSYRAEHRWTESPFWAARSACVDSFPAVA